MTGILPATMKLQSDHIGRAAKTAQVTAEMSMKVPSAERFYEALDLATATTKRFQAAQASWMSAWMDWAEYAGTLDGADTVPKYVERVGNIALRAQNQMAVQANDMSNLMENLNVSYSYWLAQQVERKED